MKNPFYIPPRERERKKKGGERKKGGRGWGVKAFAVPSLFSPTAFLFLPYFMILYGIVSIVFSMTYDINYEMTQSLAIYSPTQIFIMLKS